MSEELGKDIPVDVRITLIEPEEPPSVKDARLERAGAVEDARVERAADVESARVDSAAGVETQRVDRAAVIETERVVNVRHVRRQMIFLFVLLLVAVLALAYRTETNAHSIAESREQADQAAYEACLVRVERTSQQINPGRVALIELLLTLAASDETLTTQQRADAEDTLRAGLIVPVESCSSP